jgi:hypothetical protein
MGDSHFSVIVGNPILWVEYLDHLMRITHLDYVWIDGMRLNEIKRDEME